MRHLIITVHGIRTFGGWQERLEALLERALRNQGEQLEIYNYKFGYFSVLAFLLPPLRWLVTRQFRKRFLSRTEARAWDRIDIVAHSFGTHLSAWGLYGIPLEQRHHVHTFVLSGSVLKPGFPWGELLDSSVTRVVNDCGIRDKILLLNQLVVLFTGMAGRVGFTGMTGKRFRNRFFAFGHSGYFRAGPDDGADSDAFMRKRWLPLLTADEEIEVFEDPRPTGPLAGLATFLLNNSEPVKVTAYLGLFLAAFLWVYGLYREAERQRQVALARQLAAQAEVIRNQQPELIARSVLLAVESQRRSPSVEAYQALREGTALLQREASRLEAEDRVNAVALSPQGDQLATAGRQGCLRIWEIPGFRLLSQDCVGDLVWDLAFSQDGQWLAAVTEGGEVCAWQTSSGQRVLHENSSPTRAVSVAFTPDSTVVASAAGREVAFHEISTGDVIRRFEHNYQVHDLDLHRNGLWMALADSAGFATVWDLATEKEVTRRGHSGEVRSVAFHPTESLVASASDDRTIGVWNFSSNVEVARFQHQDRVWSVSFDSEGKRLVSASWDGTGRIWDLQTVRELGRLPHEGRVWDAAFGPRGITVATALWRRDRGSDVKIWDLSTPRARIRLPHHSHALDVAFSPDAVMVAASTIEGRTRVWSTSTGDELAVFSQEDRVPAISFHPYKDLLATASHDQTSRIWRVSDGEELERLMHRGRVWDVSFSPDGTTIATASDHSARIWRAGSDADGEVLPHHGRVWDVAWSDNGGRLATAGQDGTASVWDPATGRKVAEVRHTEQVVSADLLLNRDLLATGGDDCRARVWEAATGQELAVLPHGDDCQVHQVEFSPNGSLLATASDSPAAQLWEVESWRRAASLEHDDAVSSVSFSTDGTWLATASEDGIVRVWESQTGKQVALIPHEGQVDGVAFSATGRLLASVGTDPWVEVWVWHPDDLIELACSLLSRPLSDEEWARYLPGEGPRTTCETAEARSAVVPSL